MLGARFQSSPSPGAGRCINRSTSQRDRSVSILAQPGGRALPPTPPPQDPPARVSILAQPGGRALLFHLLLVLLHVHVSILAQPGGRALPCPLPLLGVRGFVSILAQPGGRALPDWLNQRLAHNGLVSILAQPGGRALPGAGGSCGGDDDHRFNPRPARGPGAASKSCAATAGQHSCFNPRPARGPGAAIA